MTDCQTDEDQLLKKLNQDLSLKRQRVKRLELNKEEVMRHIGKWRNHLEENEDEVQTNEAEIRRIKKQITDLKNKRDPSSENDKNETSVSPAKTGNGYIDLILKQSFTSVKTHAHHDHSYGKCQSSNDNLAMFAVETTSRHNESRRDVTTSSQKASPRQHTIKRRHQNAHILQNNQKEITAFVDNKFFVIDAKPQNVNGISNTGKSNGKREQSIKKENDYSCFNSTVENLSTSLYAENDNLNGGFPDLLENFMTSDRTETDPVIRCICDLHHDDCHMVRCVQCRVLQHADCMVVTSADSMVVTSADLRVTSADPRVAGADPGRRYYCEYCKPRSVDKQRAIDLQTNKVTAAFRSLQGGRLSKETSASNIMEAQIRTAMKTASESQDDTDLLSYNSPVLDNPCQQEKQLDMVPARNLPRLFKIQQTKSQPVSELLWCRCCNQKFTERTKLLKHRLTHIVGRRFRCLVCNEIFNTAKALRQHCRRPDVHCYPCLQCGQTCLTSNLLLTHIATCRMVEQEQAMTQFEETRSDSNTHEASIIVHNQEETQLLPTQIYNQCRTNDGPTSACFSRDKPGSLPPLVNDVEVSFKCSYCKSVFTNRQDLYNHMIIHLDKPFKCPQCEASFKSRQSLDTHIVQGHILNTKPFVCNRCEKGFQTIKSLKFHTRHQCKDRQLTCTKCEAKFDNKDQLSSHLETHKVSCQYCHVTVNSPELLEVHTRIHTGERPFSCPDCGETFISQLEADKHKDRCELLDMDKLSYTCEGCDEKFASKRGFIHHRCFRLKLDTLFRCKKCPLAFKTQEKLDKHQQVHATETNYTCADCDFTTNKPHKLQSHRNIHTKGRVCSYCGKKLASDSSLIDHLRIHTGEKPFPCPVCSVRFRTLKYLKVHEKAHLRLRRYQCIKCDRKYSSRGNMRRHLLTHYGIKQKIYKHTGVRSSTDLLCDVCGERFTEKRFLTTHKKKHSCQRPYECQTCKKRFLSRSALYNHKFVHNSEKTFECDTCKARFKTKSSFYVHKYTHQKRYYCDKCDVWFGIKHSWKCHMYKHTGEKPYQCTTCKASFRTPTGLRAHRKTHDKPYRCKQCDARFGSQEGLANHMYQHTDEKPTCSQCQKTFSGIRNLRIHLEKIHGIIASRLPRGPHRKDTTCIKTEPNENIPSHEVYAATSTTVDFKKETFASSQQVVVDIQEETRNASDALIAATTVAIDTTASTNQQLTLQEHEQILHNLTEITPGQTEQISLDSNLTKIELEDLQQISGDSETIILYMI